jgi:hypothetical protein
MFVSSEVRAVTSATAPSSMVDGSTEQNETVIDDLTVIFEEQRTHLRTVAHRLLESVHEADDAVQEIARVRAAVPSPNSVRVAESSSTGPAERDRRP